MSKQIKVIIGIVIGTVGLGILLFIAEPDDQQQSPHGAINNTPTISNILETDKHLHDFGTISMKNGKVTTVFKVKNTEAESAQLKKLYTSCMCTEATLKLGNTQQGPFGMPGHGFLPTFNETLQPNGEAEVEVVFDPNAHGPAGIGTIEREIVLEGQGGKLATLHIKATVTP